MAFLAKLRVIRLPQHVLLRQLFVSLLQKAEYSDAIENFTSELIKNQLKRDLNASKTLSPPLGRRLQTDIQLVKKTTKQLLKEINSIYDSVLCLDARKLNAEQLEALVRSSIAEEHRQDVTYLANEYMKWSLPLSKDLSLLFLEFYSRTNQLDNLERFYDYCVSLDPSVSLKLFKVKFHWAEGNVDKALRLLDEIHEVASRNPEENRDLIHCKDMFHDLISSAVGQKSEAVLLKLMHLIETLEDVSLLERMWTELFVSNWYSDQLLALGLFRRHADLRLRLSLQSNYVTFQLLRDHNVEAVYRLVELLLAHEMMAECQKVLGLLFDYQFWRKDLRSCSEIIQTCISLDIPLDANYGRKLVMLLLTPKQPPIAAKPRDGKRPPEVEFKF